MFVKGAVVASGVIAVGLAVSALNLPAVYNEMYPDDGLKRGVLGLFVRQKEDEPPDPDDPQRRTP